jgi:hypothetical protein
MKKIFITVILVLSLVSFAFADTVEFGWIGNTESDLAGYRLYASHNSGSYTYGAENAAATFGARATTGTVTVGESDVPWYFVLTAFDDTGNESGPSNEVSTKVDHTAPAAPGGLVIRSVTQ